MPDTLEHPLSAAPPQDHDATDDVEILCAADHPVRPVRWLWPGRIPIGKVTLLVGDPGLGKSLVALDVAARVSRGAAWPDEERQGDTERGRQGDSDSGFSGSLSPCLPLSLSGSPCPSATPSSKSNSGSVIILSAEDDLDDTIRPRLDAAGADPRRIFVLPSIADLRHDFAKLRQAIDRAPDCRLILIDPVNAYVGPSDSHFHTVVRRVFKPLVKLAVQKGIAILAVTHLRKNEGAAIQRAAGSMGFVAAARAVWTVCRDQAQPGRNLLLPLKHNLVADPFGLAYTIESPSPLAAPAIAWQSAAMTISATDALAAAKKPRGPEADELRAATEWLRGELAPGPREAHRVILEGHLAGFSERTLRRALYALEGATIKRNFRDGWSWSVPPAPGQPTPPPPDPKQLGPFDETWPLRENTEDFSPAPAPVPTPSDQPTDPPPTASTKQPRSPPPPPPAPSTSPSSDVVLRNKTGDGNECHPSPVRSRPG